jgi:hypothetical protein
MIDRCVRLGAERIAIVPYFLNTGVLLKRIDRRVEEAQAAHPSVSIVRAAHLGLYPSLLDLIERRARAAIAREDAQGALMAVCGRPSCSSVVVGRAALLADVAPASPTPLR